MRACNKFFLQVSKLVIKRCAEADINHVRMQLLNDIIGHSVTPSKVEGPVVVVANGLSIGMRLSSCVCENSAAKSRKRGGRLLSNLLGDVLLR